jgi:predicted DNA-binding protein (MmcQ/YjbR family)
MNLDSFRNYCLSLPHTVEDFPFDEHTIVFKVGNKIFTTANTLNFDSFNVKCNPETALELRASYACVQAGYHMNKKHWNTIFVNMELKDDELQHWIKHSYELVLASLPKKKRPH